MNTNSFYKYQLNIPTEVPADVAYRVNDNTATGEQYHVHQGLEIMQIWSENGLVLVEDHVYPMKMGHIYILNAQDMHRTTPTLGTEYIRSKLTFSPFLMQGVLEQIDHLYLLQPFLNEDYKGANHIAFDTSQANAFDNLFKKIAIECKLKLPGYSAAVRSCILEMLVIIYRSIHEKKKLSNYSAAPAHNHIKNIVHYINTNLFNDISYDEMSTEMHLSKYHICHLFKNSTGMTISQYIVSRRISEAKKLLLTETPISIIALETGFSSFSLFSRTFKTITGMTPKDFRSSNTSIVLSE